MNKYFEAALDNIIAFGDTDIFPYPIENHIFFDVRSKVTSLLLDIHGNFDDFFTNNSPINENALSPVGYTGFRWATQIDPIWNAYILGLVISIGENIERVRIPVSKNTIFSYRFKLDTEHHSLFDKIGRLEFQKKSLENAEEYKYVLICDISEFYPRIYHHRLENSLTQLGLGTDIPTRIMKFLQHCANNNSYGLPIGGPAARLLSELLLNRTDNLMKSDGITFCRFADDYHIFGQTIEQIYQNLVFISEKLLKNEGLSLQKSKTRIMTTDEFIASSEFNDEDAELEGHALEEKRFLSVSLRFDPYSQTPEEDYEALKAEVHNYDIVGMLGREMAKSRIHGALTKKLINAVKFLNPKIMSGTVRSLVDNINILSPVFPNVMILIKEIFTKLDDNMQNYICAKLRELIINNSYIMQVDLNLAYAIRVLGIKYSEENEELLVQLFKLPKSMLIRRDIILMMARWKRSHWISDIKNIFNTLGNWERRAFIVASYILGDEGRHWRSHVKKRFSPIEILFRDWASEKVKDADWNIPIWFLRNISSKRFRHFGKNCCRLGKSLSGK